MKPDVAENKRSAAELFRAWAPFVARLLARMGVPGCDLDDAVQEVFLVAHRRGGFVEGPASEKTWLAEIALRVASNARRSKRRRPTVQDDTALDNHRSGASDPHTSVEARERLVRVADALDTIPEEARLIFVLIEIEGASCDDVAKERGIPVGTVYSRLHAARKAFRAAYASALAQPKPRASLLSIVRARLTLTRASVTLDKKALVR